MAAEQSNEQEIQFKKRARRRLVGAIALVLLMVAVLPMLPLPDLPIWLTVHREIRTSRKIRAVYDFLAAEVPGVL